MRENLMGAFLGRPELSLGGFLVATCHCEFAVPPALLRFAQGPAPAGLNNGIEGLQTLSPAKKEQAAPAPLGRKSGLLCEDAGRRPIRPLQQERKGVQPDPGAGDELQAIQVRDERFPR